MAIEMASKEGALFLVVHFMSGINVAKKLWYGQLKLKPIYTIVLYYVFS